MKYIRKPVFIIPIILALLLGGAYISFKNESIGISLTLLSVLLMVVSFIDALISKKWLKGFLYFVFYSFISISTMLILVMGPALMPQTISGTTEFYNQKLNYHLEQDGEINLPSFCQQKEIIGVGPGGGDYSANCVFELDKNNYNKLISLLDKSKDFEKMKTSEFDHQIDLKALSCSKNLPFKNNGYQSVNSSSMYARIVISSDNKYCFFNLDYF